MLRTVLIYGVALALGALALQWLQYQVYARTHPTEIYITLIAVGFLGVGVWMGARLFRPAARMGAFEPNARALATLGISPREYEVLRLLASGRSNKEIAGRMGVSPHTVKTHVARLFQKLEAERRTKAILRARELELIP